MIVCVVGVVEGILLRYTTSSTGAQVERIRYQTSSGFAEIATVMLIRRVGARLLNDGSYPSLLVRTSLPY